jgi:ubiquinone/menaquinone biosynthesis C-methylase UbiE
MDFGRFADAKLLEIGCGMGTDLLQFARGGARCIGLDLTPRSIEITRHRFALYGASGLFLISDGEQLPFTSDSLDVVYSNGVLHHTPDTTGAIREIHRVLRKGGTAKVMLYHRNSINYWIEIILRRGLLKGDFFRGLSPEEIMSREVEYSEHDARPLVKVYSRKQACALFSLFEDVKVEIEQLTRFELRFLSSVISDSLFKHLRHRLGWNVIITAKK